MMLTNKGSISELINRRRRQILVHSIVYYKYDDNIISDDTWSKWAMELEDLQRQYPEIAANCIMADVFKGFEHSSGAYLPLDDPWGNEIALRLLNMRKVY